MLDYRWSHNPPTYRRTVTPNWYCNSASKVAGLQVHATTLFSIIVICSYLYSVCLVFAVLKNTYFKKHFSVVASQWILCNTENNTLEFKLCLMFKIAPMEKTWFMAPMEYIPNGKGIIVPIEYTLTVYSPNGKGMVS